SFGSASRLLVAPNKCFIKYSCPFAELETKLERQTNKERGKFSGASGSSTANDISPDFNCSTVCSTISSSEFFPCFAASSAKIKLFLLNCRLDGNHPNLAANTL